MCITLIIGQTCASDSHLTSACRICKEWLTDVRRCRLRRETSFQRSEEWFDYPEGLPGFGQIGRRDFEVLRRVGSKTCPVWGTIRDRLPFRVAGPACFGPFWLQTGRKWDGGPIVSSLYPGFTAPTPGYCGPALPQGEHLSGQKSLSVKYSIIFTCLPTHIGP